MSDTPRTDNAALHGDGTTVPADFAADLERELNAARAEVERLRLRVDRRLNRGTYPWRDANEMDCALDYAMGKK